MAVVFRSKTNATALDTTTVVTKPTGTIDGDILIVALARTGANIIDSVPSGWTELQNLEGGNSNELWVYYKIAASEGASWTWGWDGASSNKVWAAMAFTGQDPVTPIDASAIAVINNDGTPSFANTITPTIANDTLAMIVWAVQDTTNADTTTYAIATDNPTWTERLDLRPGSATTLAIATAPRPETSATGNSSVTLGADDSTEDSVCCLLALKYYTVGASVDADVISLVSSVQAPTVTGSSSVTVDVQSLTSSVQEPTISFPTPSVSNLNKTAATFTNTDKS